MPRRQFDLDALVAASRHGPCFICELVGGNPAYAHHIIAEDSDHIVFLSKYPTLAGYTLAARSPISKTLPRGCLPRATCVCKP